jgi:hypothetical protein
MSHGLFSQHNNWASHLLGPPLCLPAIPPNQASPHPSREGRGMCGQMAAVGRKLDDGR